MLNCNIPGWKIIQGIMVKGNFEMVGKDAFDTFKKRNDYTEAYYKFSMEMEPL